MLLNVCHNGAPLQSEIDSIDDFVTPFICGIIGPPNICGIIGGIIPPGNIGGPRAFFCARLTALTTKTKEE